jgi:glycosyltransferase involved in cell wall biosynthesis
MHGGHHFFAIELGKKPALWRGYQEKKSFQKADAYIAVSEYVGVQTKKHLNIDFKFTKIFNSLDTTKFSKSKHENIKKHTLLFVGTVCEKKGIRQLVQAMPQIVKEHPETKLIIVGRDWYYSDGSSYTTYLKTYIPENLEKHIEITGAVAHEKIPKMIEEAEICVYPSHMEAMPIAWLEGLLMGKPIVDGDIGPGREAILNTKTGLLANPYKPEDIAKKIIYLLDNPNEAKKLGQAAREDVLYRFHPEKIVSENIQFYESVIKG